VMDGWGGDPVDKNILEESRKTKTKQKTDTIMRYRFINGGCFSLDVWFELCCHFSLYSLHLLESTIVGFKVVGDK